MAAGPTAPLPVVVLISGRGSNLHALLKAIDEQHLPVEVRAVISNRRNAGGLQHARDLGIPTEILEHREFADREAFDQALRRTIDRYEPGLVVLAGFMRLLTTAFVNHYLGRLINIHPSLLPAYRGLNTHERALQDGVTEHGASVHFVTPELDSGPVILQAAVPVQKDDTVETLAERVLNVEHKIYPLAVKWFAENRVQLKDHRVWFDNRPVDRATRLNELETNEQ
jgi:phosphoribosylglycinamide formyltransferase-1